MGAFKTRDVVCGVEGSDYMITGPMMKLGLVEATTETRCTVLVLEHEQKHVGEKYTRRENSTSRYKKVGRVLCSDQEWEKLKTFNSYVRARHVMKYIAFDSGGMDNIQILF